MKRVVFLVAAAAILLLCGISLLPLVPTDVWWVRVTDFPRLQLVILLLALLIVASLQVRRFPRSTAVLWLAGGGILIYNAVILLPYLPTGSDLARNSCPADHRLKIMVANVRLTNAPDGRLLDQVRHERPDLFLALEVDQDWTTALASLADSMPHQVIHPTGSYFGIALYSRLELVTPAVEHFAGQDTPQIQTGVRLPTGEVIDFLGLHPRPPHPSQSALGRDAVLLTAGFHMRDSERPGVVAGDLNAVPWESAVAMMQDIGHLIDPRHGYGYLPSYSATSWWRAWPLDHVFFEPGFAALHLTRGAAFGSDHYPYVATLCRVGPGRSEQPEPPETDLLRDAREIITRARAKAAGS